MVCTSMWFGAKIFYPHLSWLLRWHWDNHITPMPVNTLRPRQNERHFADDIFKYISLNENVWIPIKISLKFLPKGRINNIPALVQIMAWRRSGYKPLSEPMMIDLPMHICVTRPQWVKKWVNSSCKSTLKFYFNPEWYGHINYKNL